ncbi:fasciclin domain-containing protein [Parapedobacter tibetensis]|uniref:fasciclin domain-containing protein n=1 Tax=Parapedobacter tibetensis TaxID=2972951 RepID=UPI00214D71EB|nr:fasciclin domain-containing protein [Parapedobacter tibetensis]
MKRLGIINNKQRFTAAYRALGLVLLLGSLWLSSCKRDDYYTDGGLANPYFNGTVLEYLESRPIEFDTIAQIVRLAGLEEVFTTHELTFFAPRDEDIKDLIGQVNYTGDDPLLMGGVNQRLYDLGLDTIQTLADVDSAIWRKYLERHMFRNKNLLVDYPQIDFAILATYGGQNYYAYNNTVSNIGVVFHDAVTDAGKPTETRLKYQGYRQLHISYIPNLSQPDNWETVSVASSDIQPNNGVVHVLDYTVGFFGFIAYDVFNDIVQSKR